MSAWEQLKSELSEPGFLAAPDITARKTVMTDASDYGLGGFLIQFEEGGVCQPVEFTSKRLKSAEKYTVTEKECLAIVHALKKCHYLHGEPTFTVLSDQEALKWLMSLRELRGRLARWMCEIQDYDFVVEYKPGEFMAVADTLSRDAVEEHRCRKCNERVLLLTEGTRSLTSVAEIKRAQLDEFGVLQKYDEDGQKFILDEEGLLCLATGERLRIVIPRVMVDQFLEYAHGAKPNGHRGVWKTLSWIKQRFWWKGCAKDVSHSVRKCVHCSLHRLGRPGRQGRMMTWHPLRRFQVVAIDVMEVSPKSRNGCIKVAVMGDLFIRYV